MKKTSPRNIENKPEYIVIDDMEDDKPVDSKKLAFWYNEMKKLKLLPKHLLLILLIIFTSCSKTEEINIVNDFVFSTMGELKLKYGKPRTDLLNKVAEWQLKDNVTVTVFYEEDYLYTPSVIRFKNLDVDYEIFYYDLGWDLPHLDWKPALGKTTVNGLQGIKEATFHKGANTLSIELDNPQSQTFGKKDN